MSSRPAIDRRREALIEERDFLLRSLRDLQAERAAGDVDEADYLSLRAGYTARAASVIRALEHSNSDPTGSRRSPWKVVIGVVAVVAIGVATGLALANAWGTRLPGATITGGDTADDVTVLLSQARQLLNVEPGDAAAKYQQVLELRPDDPEALTYLGWITVLGSQQSAEALAEGTRLLRRAAVVDPTYPDPHCFLAVAAANIAQPADLPTARSEGERCLLLNPPAAMRSMIEQFLADLG